MLWRLQRCFFEQTGIEAWRHSTVPHYITSNPFIAQAYARIVLGFLRDCRAVTGESEGFAPLDPRQPVYIIELGAGSGRFGYYFMSKLLDIQSRSTLSDIPIRYVLTDFSERTLEYWRTHPWLQPLIEAGRLDLARFDAGHDEELVLDRSRIPLTPRTVKNPIVVLANYFFDSIPQDAFHVDGGKLYESRVTLLSSQTEPDLEAPALLDRVRLSYQCYPIDSGYYGDPEFDRILEMYRQRLPHTHLLFPCEALQCLRILQRLSGGRLLLLSGDKGYSREEDLLERDAPGIAVHGSFSMSVNYHAIGQYVLHQGGHFLHALHSHTNLDVCAFLLGPHPAGYPETRLAYAENVSKGGPDDFYLVKKSLEAHPEDLTLEQLLAYLRLSGWDSKILLDCFSTFLERMADADEDLRQEIYWALEQIWDTYYPIGETEDLPFQIGLLLYKLKYYPEAIAFFQRSIDLQGMDPTTSCNMGLCYYRLRQLEEALSCTNQALALDAEFEPAKALRIKIQSDLERTRTR